MGRRWITALLAGAALGIPTAASAQPDHDLRLSYDVGPDAASCPTEDALRADVAALLGSDPFDESAAGGLECEIQRSDGGYRAEIRIVDEHDNVLGRRELTHEGPDCDELGRAVGIAIAMVIERPEEIVAAPEPATEPEPEPEPVPEPDIEPEPEPAAVEAHSIGTAPAPSTPIVPFVVAGAGGSFDTETQLAGQFELGGGVRRGALSAALSVRLDSRDSARVAADSTVTVITGAAVATPCYHHASLAACGVVSVGFVRGRGNNLEMSTPGLSPHVGVGGRVAWSARASRRFELRFTLEALAAVSRTTILVDGAPVWESAAAQFGLGLEVLAHFR